MEHKRRKLIWQSTALLATLAVLLILGGNLSAFGQTSNTIWVPIIINPSITNTNTIHDGKVTYYAPTNVGACMFGAPPSDMLVGAMNGVEWNNAAYCGAYIHIWSSYGDVTVKIVDRCPECLSGHIDLSKEAFFKLAPAGRGGMTVQWQVVSPNITGPIAYQFKDGSSKYWTAVQIRNHRNPIAKLEFLDSSGQWVDVRRTYYNYFIQEHGMGPGPYSFRVTDWYGNVLTDSGIPFIENGVVNGSNQLPPWP